MTALLEWKEKLKAFYGKFSMYLNPVLKFILALAVFIHINTMLGFLTLLNNVFVVLILALLCAILPLSAIVVFGCLLIMGHCYAVGIEVAAFAAVLILLLLLLYLRFAPKDSLALVLTPLSFGLHIPCAVPIGFGLVSNAGSAVSAACGVILYYFMKLVGEKAVMLQSGEVAELSQRLTALLDGLVQNPRMWLDLIAFVAVVLVVYCIRRASMDHAWTAAITTGGLLYMILQVAGSFLTDADVPVLSVIAGAAGAIVLMLVLEFFLFNVDYTRAEYLQYEDDDYYYYVKAVPKIKMTQSSRSVKTIETEEVPDMDVQRKETLAVSERKDPDPAMDNLEEKLEESLKNLDFHSR